MRKPNDFIGFQIIQIKTEEFAVLPELFDENNTEISLGLDFAFGLDKSERVIACSAEIKFLQSDRPFIKLKITNSYLIEEESWQRLQEDGKFIIPKGFTTHLLVLTIGTLRGVLHAKTEGTDFNKFVLPTLNVADLINEDLVL